MINQISSKNQINNDYSKNKNFPFFSIIFGTILFLILVLSIYIIYTLKSDKIGNNIYIYQLKVSSLTKQEAKYEIEKFISKHSQEELILIHNDDDLEEPFESSINVNQIECQYLIDDAIDSAYNYNHTGNTLNDIKNTLELMFVKHNFDIEVVLNEEILEKSLQDISKNLPDAIVESSYYIDNDNLILTKGKQGCVVDLSQMVQIIKFHLTELNYKGDKISLVTKKEKPTVLNLKKIYTEEIKKEPKNASFNSDPYEFYPSEYGVDFKYSLEEELVNFEKCEDELSIPLVVVKPEITTSMIGNEAFPSVLAEYSTNYVNNANRTTNLKLAANKINGTVLMPDETFSYNKVVGERTIAAGYKNAAIYENGAVVDGLGGGICQVTTTLYGAVLRANLEIVYRTNHMFVPTYVKARQDATVVYGSIDFVFKNNRDYPVKIECSVQNGVCYFKILGLSYDTDPRVEITSTYTNSSSYTYSTTYKTLYDPSGNKISSEIISKDTYKRH